MDVVELGVSSEEQTIYLQDGYSATIRFDMIYKRWFFDLYLGEELVYAGIPLGVDTVPLLNISKEGLGLIDAVKDKLEYEPYSELGSRLVLVEVTQ